MPRIKSKRKDYIIADFRKWLRITMAANDVKQYEVAEWLGISQPAVSVKIKNGEFTLKELLIIFDKLQTPAEEIGSLLKV